MEMHQIRYFLAVSRTLNFTRAADECNVAQPSLTRAIKKLEEELGGELFRRERQRTHPTELGRMMLPLLTQCHEGALTAKTLAGSYGAGDYAPLRLALSQTIGLVQFVEHITELTRAMPGLELSFFRGSGREVAEELETGAAELGIAGPLDGGWDRLDAVPLFNESFRLAVHRDHALARQNEVDVARLAGERVLARPYCETGEELARALAAHGVELLEGHRMCSDADAVALIEAGIGMSIMPATADHSDRLRSIDLTGLELERTVCLYSVAGRQRSPAAAGLIKLLRAGVPVDPS